MIGSFFSVASLVIPNRFLSCCATAPFLQVADSLVRCARRCLLVFFRSGVVILKDITVAQIISVREEMIHRESWIGAILRTRSCAGFHAKTREELSPARARLQRLCTCCIWKHTVEIVTK